MLVRNENTDDLCKPLSSNTVLKRKKEMLSVPMDFKYVPPIHTLSDIGVSVRAIAESKKERIEQQTRTNIFKIEDRPRSLMQLANRQLEKLIAAATIKVDIGDYTFGEHIVAINKLTGPINGLNFGKHNSVGLDTTRGLIHFSHLTNEFKIANSEKSAKPQPVVKGEILTILPMTTETNKVCVNHAWDWKISSTLTSLERFTKTASYGSLTHCLK